jgi:hypothetical protein
MMGQHQQEIVTGSALRRMLLVFTVAAVMAAMLAMSAVPAFAGGHCNRPTGEFTNCGGGEGEKGGGGGGHFFTDGPQGGTSFVESGNDGPGGGGGGRCSVGDFNGPQGCVGNRTS